MDWAKPTQRSELTTINTTPSTTACFNYGFSSDRRISLPSIGRYKIEANIGTLLSPGYDVANTLLLRNTDGIVFVVDSQKNRHEDNLAAWAHLQSSLVFLGRNPEYIPTAIQFNKRDLPGRVRMDRFVNHFKLRGEVPPYFGTVATQGIEVLEPLRSLLKRVVKEARRIPT